MKVVNICQYKAILSICLSSIRNIKIGNSLSFQKYGAINYQPTLPDYVVCETLHSIHTALDMHESNEPVSLSVKVSK